MCPTSGNTRPRCVGVQLFSPTSKWWICICRTRWGFPTNRWFHNECEPTILAPNSQAKGPKVITFFIKPQIYIFLSLLEL
ncbi:hypothetical protein Hanom_Chr17g01552101 [Helianthus anomalus]